MKVLLITPPLTQLNTPYPATPYLKGFLVADGHEVSQADLGIELVNRIFSREGLQAVFKHVKLTRQTKAPIRQLLMNQQRYIDSIDAVEIIMAIEDEFEIEIPDEVAEQFTSIADIMNYLNTVGIEG